MIKNMTGVDIELVEAVIKRSWYHERMENAIRMIVIGGRRKAHVAKELSVSRQHVTRTVNDFYKRMLKIDKYLR
jgi:hypothetical protein